MRTGRALTQQDPEMQPGSAQPAAGGGGVATASRGAGLGRVPPRGLGVPRLEEALGQEAHPCLAPDAQFPRCHNGHTTGAPGGWNREWGLLKL